VAGLCSFEDFDELLYDSTNIDAYISSMYEDMAKIRGEEFCRENITNLKNMMENLTELLNLNIATVLGHFDTDVLQTQDDVKCTIQDNDEVYDGDSKYIFLPFYLKTKQT
jgi:23S rRNA C2498 (ribose-2'-O)-methylase RlmM